ncbi:MAG TPA: AAA family ATPase, partial [Solirubrobacteraceae bacterium]
MLTKLAEGQDVPLVTIVAPAGYGKTSLLAEWTGGDSRPSVFFSLEQWHEDPRLLVRDLLHALLRALEEIEPLDARLCEAQAELDSDPAISVLLPTLVAVLEAWAHPLVLILDDADLLEGVDASQVLSVVDEHLAPGSQLVLASRASPALPLGRLRAHGALLELGAEELAMTRTEAASLFRAAGIKIDTGGLDPILQRTEGWPAGLYLAALCAREAPDAEAVLAGFTGDDRVVADYLRDEFLSG